MTLVSKWVCTKIDPIPPRFCQSDAASANLRWAADRDDRMNLYGDALSSTPVTWTYQQDDRPK